MLYPSLVSSFNNFSDILNAQYQTPGLSDLLRMPEVPTMGDIAVALQQLRSLQNMSSPISTPNAPAPTANTGSLADFQKTYGEYLQPLPKWANTNFKVPDNLSPIFSKYSQQFGVPYWLAAAVAQQESSFNPNLNAWPNDGAGVMQLTPDEAKKYGVTNVLDPDQNIRAGINLLADLYKQTGSWDLAVAAYNGGLGKVRGGRIGFNKPSKANFYNKAFTINHVWKILNMWGYR